MAYIFIFVRVSFKGGFPGGSVVENLLPVQETQETWVQSLGQEDPLEKEMATHFSILTWNPTDRGAWQATVHRVTKSWTLSKWACMHTSFKEQFWNSKCWVSPMYNFFFFTFADCVLVIQSKKCLSIQGSQKLLAVL